MIEPMNRWIGSLFDPVNVDRTVAALVASQGGAGGSVAREAVKRRLAEAQAQVRRFQAAIGAGADPAALVEALNAAQEQRVAAQVELDGMHAPELVTDAEVYAMIDSLGDVGEAFDRAEPDSLDRLYRELGLELVYEPAGRTFDVRISPRVVNVCDRGGN